MQSIKRAFSWVNTMRQQVGLIRVAPLLLTRAINRLADPSAQITYSQFCEDRVIEQFFKDTLNGTYVDIGCNHPTSYSNTWKLYLKGWTRICVDANPHLIDLYRKARPKDIVLQRVISNSNVDVDFYFSKTSNLISGIGEKASGNWKRTKGDCTVVKCASTALSSLLLKYEIRRQFELLCIDVEGHELQVLESMDINLFKPLLIVVEMHNFDLANPSKDPVFSMLTSHGYHLISYLTPNGFFSLAAPANV